MRFHILKRMDLAIYFQRPRPPGEVSAENDVFPFFPLPGRSHTICRRSTSRMLPSPRLVGNRFPVATPSPQITSTMIEGPLTGSPGCLLSAAARAPELLEPTLKITTRESPHQEETRCVARRASCNPQSYFCVDPGVQIAGRLSGYILTH